MATFLLVSIVLSVVLTVLLNVVLWTFPGLGQRMEDAVRRAAARSERADRRDGSDRPDHASASPRIRVIAPWKVMIVGSLVLTLVLNLVVRLLG